jgi:hypothetical protein
LLGRPVPSRDVDLPAERGPVPGQQGGGVGADLRGDHPGVQAPFGAVEAVELDVGSGQADAVEGGHEGVEVVDDLVGVRQQGAGDAEAVTFGLEQADQEGPVVGRVAGQVVAVQPAVDVGVPQVWALLAQAAQVAQVDAEFGGDPLIGHHGGPVDPGGAGDSVGGHLLHGAADDQVALVGVDGGGGDDVQPAGPLGAQEGDHVGQGGVAGGQDRRGSHGWDSFGE